ncbi:MULTISPECIES: hypothetical protein [unclassified Exiguobacterium]|uniref:hypothetical protein n=1 Tax=unclassified Exiguobacterium TaxID=2644629 RepID=UPI000B58C3F0|nr:MULTISPECIES: hypothetical protein [unclassified Exiguobacterium]ASI35269.1 hypothetical protein A0126_06715 [Exiguobacterium sp. N4-1P]ASI37282.1 hypothetical protein A0126_16990 [Exiguobacterium sp. N4-1P]
MSTTLGSLLAILIMLVTIIYGVVYIQKKKRNTDQEATYKIVFTTAIVLLALPFILTIFK